MKKQQIIDDSVPYAAFKVIFAFDTNYLRFVQNRKSKRRKYQPYRAAFLTQELVIDLAFMKTKPRPSGFIGFLVSVNVFQDLLLLFLFN